MGTTIERLYQFIEYKGVSVNEFSTKIGVSNGYLAKQRNASANIGSHILENIVRAYPELSIEWLVLGKGEMQKRQSECYDHKKKPSGAVSEKQADYNSIPTSKTTSPDGIPLIPVDAMAGAMRGEVSVMEYECERYVIPIFKGADFLIPVKGNSMYPKYSSGDIVACKRVPMTDLFFQWNKVYVLDTNQGALIKRIKPGSDTSRVLIVSENPAYDPFELPLEAIHAVALVMGVIRLE